MALQWLARLLDRASRIRNDSSVSGSNVKEALEALAAGAGGIVGPDPSVVDSVSVWADATGTTLRDSELIVHSTANDKLQTNATFQAWTTAADGSTVTFDLDQSDQHKVTYAGNRTLAIDNESVGQTLHLLRIQDGTGNRVESWFSNISWNHGLAPVQDPTAAGWDLVTLKCRSVSIAGSPGTPAEWVEVCRTSSAPRKAILSVTCAATTTFDLRKSHTQSTTLDRNPTLELQAGCYSEGNVRFALQLVQDGTGGRTVTFGTSFGTITWTATGGVAPTLPTAAGASCWLVFICTNAGLPAFECVGATGVVSSLVSDTAYNATTWNGVTNVCPSQNAVRDKFEEYSTSSSVQFAQLGLGRTPNLLGAGAAVSVSNASFSACELIRSTATLSGDVGAVNFFNGTTQIVSFAVRGDGATDSGAFEVWTRATGGSITRRVTCTSAGLFGVGSTQPLGQIEGRATSGMQIVAAYDASNSLGLSVGSTGICSLMGAGSAKGLILTDGIVAGSGTARAKAGGTISSNVTATGNVGAGEDTLHTYTIPASTLSANGKFLRIKQAVSFAANGNAKQYRIKYGATTIYDSGSVLQNGGSAVFEIVITRTGTASQMVLIQAQFSASSLLASPTPYQTTSETMSSTSVFTDTGSATADNDIVSRATIIEWGDA